MSRPSDEEIKQYARDILVIQSQYKGDTVIDTAYLVALWAMDQVEAKQEAKMDDIDKLLYNDGDKPKMERALTFEEWMAKYKASGKLGDRMFIENMADCYKAGQESIAANAIEIPDESEWPEWATGIRADFINQNPICRRNIQFIPRPKPVWNYNLGDKVFFLDDVDGVFFVNVAIVIESNIQMAKDVYAIKINSGGRIITINAEYVKPFDSSKIGLPWDKI